MNKQELIQTLEERKRTCYIHTDQDVETVYENVILLAQELEECTQPLPKHTAIHHWSEDEDVTLQTRLKQLLSCKGQITFIVPTKYRIGVGVIRSRITEAMIFFESSIPHLP